MHSGVSSDGNYDSKHWPLAKNEPIFPDVDTAAKKITELKHYQDLLARDTSLDCRLSVIAIDDRLRQLTKAYRTVLFVSYIMGVRVPEAAKRFGITQLDYKILLRAAKQSYLELV